LWLQRLTTGEPTDDMIEVAIAALAEVRTTEAGAAPVEAPTGCPAD